MAQLIMIRHGESVWNVEKRITGIADVPLTELGREQIRNTAEKLDKVHIDEVFVSPLIRAVQTYEILAKTLGLTDISVHMEPSFAEHDFGEITGLLKADAQEELGADRYQEIMASWDGKAEGGESFSDVYARVVPRFRQAVLPILQNGKNVLIVSHHHTLRALMGYLEHMPSGTIIDKKLKNGQAAIYESDAAGEMRLKRYLS